MDTELEAKLLQLSCSLMRPLTCVAGEGVLGLGAAEQVVVGDHELGAGVPRLQLHLGSDALALPLEGGDVGLLEAGVEAVI